jgi:hypothetical protein
MHRPGYVQGGQEVGCGYLLLGIHYRRIPGDIEVESKKLLFFISCPVFGRYTVKKLGNL